MWVAGAASERRGPPPTCPSSTTELEAARPSFTASSSVNPRGRRRGAPAPSVQAACGRSGRPAPSRDGARAGAGHDRLVVWRPRPRVGRQAELCGARSHRGRRPLGQLGGDLRAGQPMLVTVADGGVLVRPPARPRRRAVQAQLLRAQPDRSGGSSERVREGFDIATVRPAVGDRIVLGGVVGPPGASGAQQHATAATDLLGRAPQPLSDDRCRHPDGAACPQQMILDGRRATTSATAVGERCRAPSVARTRRPASVRAALRCRAAARPARRAHAAAGLPRWTTTAASQPPRSRRGCGWPDASRHRAHLPGPAAPACTDTNASGRPGADGGQAQAPAASCGRIGGGDDDQLLLGGEHDGLLWARRRNRRGSRGPDGVESRTPRYTLSAPTGPDARSFRRRSGSGCALGGALGTAADRAACRPPNAGSGVSAVVHEEWTGPLSNHGCRSRTGGALQRARATQGRGDRGG